MIDAADVAKVLSEVQPEKSSTSERVLDGGFLRLYCFTASGDVVGRWL